MRFVTTSLGEMFRAELKSAAVVHVAVAFFDPDEKTLSGLQRLRKLTLVISDNFEINNPHKLEKLNSRARLLSISSDARQGKLHSKVFLIQRRDRSHWGMIGSANLTDPGMRLNREACVVLNSNELADKQPLEDAYTWFDSILKYAHSIDFASAKQKFANRGLRGQRETEWDSLPSAVPDESKHCWVLKTTSGSSGEDHWLTFVKERVVAIGWQEVRVDPSAVRLDNLREAVRAAHPEYSEGKAKRVARKLKMFTGMRRGDRVVICAGYAPNQTKDVHIYGIAKVVDDRLQVDWRSSWWRFKRRAAIRRIDENLPYRVIAAALAKRSLREAIHKIDPQRFSALREALRDARGVIV